VAAPDRAINACSTPPDKATQRIKGRLNLDVLPHTFGPVIVVAIMTAALLLAYPGLSSGRYPPKAGPDMSLPLNAPADPLKLKDIFDERLKQYRINIDQLYSNLQLQALFTFLCLLLVLSRSSSLQVFGNNVPLRWLHMFIPAVMLYLWLSFGFLLDDLIKDRINGAQMIEQLSPGNATLAKRLLRDSRFVDGWIVTFVDPPKPRGTTGPYYGAYSGINHNAEAGTALFLLSLLGTWVAAAHAATLAIVAVGARRYLRTSRINSVAPYYLLPLIPFAFFAVSHYQFAYGGPNRNSAQVFIAVVAVALYLALLWLSVTVDRIRAPSTLACLKRRRKMRIRQISLETGEAKGPELRVALIGDSLSTDFHLGRWYGIAYRLWFTSRCNWFNGDTTRTPPIQGVLTRIGARTAVAAYNRASATASVTQPRRRTFVDWISNTFHFEHQVDEMVGEAFPDLVLLWIGHNNVDWANCASSDEVKRIATAFADAYEIQLRRLVGMANDGQRPVTVIVFGLVNFRAFFSAREQAESKHASNRRHFPFAERAYGFFESMKPEHRQTMIGVADRCNEQLDKLCTGVQSSARQGVRIVFARAMSQAPINSSSMLHRLDAWHPSQEGHQVLADAAWTAVEPELRRLES
jgi:lysophospholipase L1-like esterase